MRVTELTLDVRKRVGNRAAYEAKRHYPYVYYANGDYVNVNGHQVRAFDCSGFTQWIWEQETGLVLPHNTVAQKNCPLVYYKSPGPVHLARLLPGDLVFYRGADLNEPSPGHVAMYIGTTRLRKKMRVAQATNPARGTETIRIDQLEPPIGLGFVMHR